MVQSHVTLQKVHQVVLEATVGGKAGDIAIDDITFTSGPCPASGNKAKSGENHILNMDISLFPHMIQYATVMHVKDWQGYLGKRVSQGTFSVTYSYNIKDFPLNLAFTYFSSPS